METIHIIEAELEELKKKYWQCFNNWDCDEDLQKIQYQIEELKYKLSVESLQMNEELIIDSTAGYIPVNRHKYA
jgi:hypothetical protein